MAAERTGANLPASAAGDGDGDRVGDSGGGGDDETTEVYHRLNTAGNEIIEDSNFESDDDDLIDTENSNGENNACKERMEGYIHLIRDFCDGLEFQVKYQDPRFLRTVEREGAGFIRLAQSCLSRERRLNSSRANSPSTWEKSTASALFYRSRPRDHGI